MHHAVALNDSSSLQMLGQLADCRRGRQRERERVRERERNKRGDKRLWEASVTVGRASSACALAAFAQCACPCILCSHACCDNMHAAIYLAKLIARKKQNGLLLSDLCCGNPGYY